MKKNIKVDNFFDIILNSNMLENDDIESLKPLSDELKETFEKVQVFRTETEMEVSVLNNLKFPDANSKYWQAVREQNGMFQELVGLSYDYRKIIVQIKILERDMKKEKELEQELIRIKIEKKKFILKGQEKVAKNRIREIKLWSKIKKREAKKMSDNELKDVDNGQLISYTKRFINQNMKMGNNGSPAEIHNLMGQLNSSILACIEKKVIDDVLIDYSEEVVNKIKSEYKI